MNSMATSGKNLRKPELGVIAQRGHETRAVAPSAPDHEHHALFSSLCEAKRTPVSSLQQHVGASREARNYGGRKLRYRWVDDLKPWQVHMLHEADFRAAQLGYPLNIFITINHHGTFAGGAAMASTFARGMKRMTQWLRSNGLPAAYVYVHENPGDEKPNSHVLVYVPAHLIRPFKAKVDGWYGALDGGVKVDPRNDAQRRAKGLGTRLQYMAKGAPDFTCRNYGGRRARGGQGPITIKRAGVSQFLSKPVLTARNGEAAA